ncbi:MAG: alpha/beta hydrolase [Bacteroides sp.]|nr:alpha/beta hydrolase [Bacteroides sp.]
MKKIKLYMGLALLLSAGAANAQPKEILSLNGSEGKLYAELQKPSSEKEKIPLVIICHGFTGNCNTELMTNIADDLQGQGIASLRFDFNGHGKSEGEFQNMTVLNEIEDLKDVISWAQTQQWVESISLLGHSQGGVVVSMTAGELGDGVIKNVVLMAPAAVLRDDAIRGNTQGAQYDPWDFKGDYVELPWGGYKLGRKYVESAVNLPIYETAWRYTGPVLVIQGTHDRIVPYTYAERYQTGYKNCTLKLIPEEDHSFTKETAEAALYASDWLSKQIHDGH